jgi:transcriptional regulator with XRE-family HTH domain
MTTEERNRLADLQAAFASIGQSLTDKEKAEVDGQVLSSQLMGLIDEKLQERKQSRKAIAQGIGTSASYVTQLFYGDRMLNMVTLAKMLNVLDMSLDCKLVDNQKHLTIEKWQLLSASLDRNTGIYEAKTRSIFGNPMHKNKGEPFQPVCEFQPEDELELAA